VVRLLDDRIERPLFVADIDTVDKVTVKFDSGSEDDEMATITISR
jgi:hypothetical protein